MIVFKTVSEPYRFKIHIIPLNKIGGKYRLAHPVPTCGQISIQFFRHDLQGKFEILEHLFSFKNWDKEGHLFAKELVIHIKALSEIKKIK